MKFVLISILFFNSLYACSVCYGSPDEPAVKAAQAGILFLLGVISFVSNLFGWECFDKFKKNAYDKILQTQS